MRIIKKLRINFCNGDVVRRFYIFGKPVIEYKKTGHKRKWQLYHMPKPYKGQRVFYLKINRIHQTSFDCIQQWMDIVEKMDGFCYFVCDNKQMEYNVFTKPCWFHNKKFAFIPSDRKTLRSELKRILHNVEREKLWRRIASSMMTPFIHAAKHNYTRSYNIDADDIMLLAKSDALAKAFIKAEEYAEQHDLDCFNLDMFVSKTFGVHWSFGVVYVRKPQKCIGMVVKNTNWRENTTLIEQYKCVYLKHFNFNVDWLFTFLRDTKQLNLKTFYIENAMVVHMPDIAISRHWAFMFQWRNNNINFPILRYLYADEIWQTLPIYKECVQINIGLSEKSYTDFLNEFYHSNHLFEHQMLDFALTRKILSKQQYKLLKN